jgi:hypothetical protein
MTCLRPGQALLIIHDVSIEKGINGKICLAFLHSLDFAISMRSELSVIRLIVHSYALPGEPLSMFQVADKIQMQTGASPIKRIYSRIHES